MGTIEGYCFIFRNDIIHSLKAMSAKYTCMSKFISEYSVDGIVCTDQCVWLAHARYISFLKLDDLTSDGSIHHESEQEAYIGQLSLDPDHNLVWSAHLGGTVLSSWDAVQRSPVRYPH